MEVEKKKDNFASQFSFEKEKKVSFIARLEAGSDKELFMENLSLLLASGMDTVSALTALRQEAKTGGMRLIIGQMLSDIESGTVLSVALEKTGLFGANIVSLIKIGEETGKLSENLKVVSDQLQKERSFRSKISSAMMYPVFVLSLTLIVGVSIAWIILPRLATVFADLDIQLPLITKFLIDVGVFLNQYGAVFVPSFIFGVLLLIYFIFVFPKTKFIGQELLFSFPGISELVGQVELARFGFMLGNLLSAGLPIVTAFDSLIDVTTFKSYRKLYKFLRDRVEEGNSFAKSFAAYEGINRLIPPSIQQMVVAAEQSGFLADTLLKIGERFEEKTDVTTKNLSTILEPILLVIVWFGVAGVALAVILPIYSLIGGFTEATQPPSFVSPSVTVSVSPTPTEAPTPTPKVTMLQVLPIQIGYLNVRQEPSTAATILGRAVPGDSFEFKTRQGDWYQIVFKDGLGWVNATYVQELP